MVTVPGEPATLKVTEPLDLDIVRGAGPRPAAQPVRYAWGTDSHPFGSLDGLRLAGLLIRRRPGCTATPTAMRPARALRRAAGGCPAGRPRPPLPLGRGPDPRRRQPGAAAPRSWRAWAEQGSAVDASTLTIVGARPRLGGARLERCAAHPGGLCWASTPSGVSVKASTGNLSGDEGAGRTISATCLVGVVPAMTLRFRNTLGGALEAFEPLEPGHVRMYTCGPTVYAPAHVGNFRSFVFADLAAPLPATGRASASRGS